MKNNPKNILTASALIAGLAGFSSIAQAAVTWDGDAGDSLWSSATNWSGDAVPVGGDDVIIDGAAVTWDITTDLGSFAGNSLTLSGVTTMTVNTVFRGNGKAINVGSQATLAATSASTFYDLRDSTVTFDSGAQFTSGVWENKGTSHFVFNLEATGFQTLTPSIFNVSGAYNTTTYTVDLGSYTGGATTIVLADFGSEFSSTTDADFQTSTHNIINAGAFTGSTLAFNEVDKSFVLTVAVPEPGTYALLGGCFALSAVMLRRRQR